MGNMRFKVGDRVRIKNLDWYKENMDEYGHINYGYAQFIPDMSLYCGEVLTICDVEKEFSYYHMKECKYVFMDEMIEGLVEEESSIDLTVKGEEIKERIEITIPEGYEYVIESDKIIFTKKKKEYPKTYCECKDILGLWDIDDTERGYYKTDLIDKLQMLLICRDAYWKIAGEEMGLGKPWETDWGKGACYTICCNTNRIVIGIDKFRNSILAFPTEEMRDAFYENFKELIESCKELL